MKITGFAIENHQFTIVIIIMLVLSGILSILTMPYSEDPQVSTAGTTIIVVYPGTSPIDMEQLVVDPIEEAVNELDDIRTLESLMRDSVATISVEFEVDADPDEKHSDVTEKVNSIRNKLPEGITSIEMIKWGSSNVNILQLAIVSETAEYAELEKAAENLKKRLNRIGGVKDTEIMAFPDREVRVDLDLARMSRKGISLNQVIGVIQSANMNIPGGSLEIGDKSYAVQTSGSFRTIEEIGDTVIDSDGRTITRLRDIADLRFDYKDEEYIARFNGKRAVFIASTQKEGTNIFRIFREIREVVSKFESDLPESMEVAYVFDQSKSVAARIKLFGYNLLQGMVLVGLVVFLSLSFRASVIIMLAIPISILIGIGFVDLTGYGIEQMTIAGLVIALGILVDNAIVVTENTTRFLRMGYGRREAAIEATHQISWAIVSATVTTILAFVPIMMIGDITGDFIRSMPTTVVYTLTASLFIALTLTPYLASKFLRAEIEQNAVKRNAVFSVLAWLPSKIRSAQEWLITGPYRRTLDFALRHGVTIVAISMVLFLASLGLFKLVGVSFFPKAEKPQLIIEVSTPEGTNIHKTDEVAKYVESVLARRKEIKHFAANVGNGNPRIYYNLFQKSRDMSYAQFYVELHRYERLEMERLVRELRAEFDKYDGAQIDVKELEQGPPVEAPVAIRILSGDLDRLREVAGKVADIIESTEGTVNVSNPLEDPIQELKVVINREKAAMLGIQLVDIDRAVRACVSGLSVAKFRDREGEEFDITIHVPTTGGEREEPNFAGVYLTSAIGAQVPLRQLVRFEFQAGAQRITHRNLERHVTVTADVMGGYSTDRVTKAIVRQLDALDWDETIRYEVGGESESRFQSFSNLRKAIVIALVSIFAVLILQFRSFKQPIIVFVAIPMALIGAIEALLITGNSFSFTAFVGLTSLVGIVVNNSIILVEYTNQLRKSGVGLIDAVKEAGETRFRPILFTTATTIGGLLPLTLKGGSLWGPMGWTIIGGLTVSTLLTLIVVPVLYTLLTPESEMNEEVKE